MRFRFLLVRFLPSAGHRCEHPQQSAEEKVNSVLRFYTRNYYYLDGRLARRKMYFCNGVFSRKD
jgi:hypothetical protein